MSSPPPPGPHQPPRASSPPPAPHGPRGARGPAGDGGPAGPGGAAVASLVLGALCFLPAAGLVAGVIALRRTERTGERGRGLALAGSALSLLGLVLWAASLTTGFASGVWEHVRDGATAASSPIPLDRGDCFDSPTRLEGMAYDVDPVSCSGRHDGEVFAVVTLPGGPYPGEASLTDTAGERCYALEDTYAMDPWAVPGNVGVYYLLPSPDGWRLGDREITCLFGNSRESGWLTGSLRSDEATLDPHQTAFLTAARIHDRALARAPEEYAEDDLPGHREWARAMAAATGGQTRVLRGHDWPPDARGPVAALVSDLRQARGEWLAAARAHDAGTYDAHCDTALELTGPPRSVTARKALGLVTAPPDPEGSGGDAGEEPGLRV